ncbi:MAG: hypothetical protein NXI20_03210 [bacterium]|nr:hypothetical protein [bacterium]
MRFICFLLLFLSIYSANGQRELPQLTDRTGKVYGIYRMNNYTGTFEKYRTDSIVIDFNDSYYIAATPVTSNLEIRPKSIIWTPGLRDKTFPLYVDIYTEAGDSLVQRGVPIEMRVAQNIKPKRHFTVLQQTKVFNQPLVIDFKDYFSDPNGDELTFGWKRNTGGLPDIEDGILTLDSAFVCTGCENNRTINQVWAYDSLEQDHMTVSLKFTQNSSPVFNPTPTRDTIFVEYPFEEGSSVRIGVQTLNPTHRISILDQSILTYDPMEKVFKGNLGYNFAIKQTEADLSKTINISNEITAVSTTGSEIRRVTLHWKIKPIIPDSMKAVYSSLVSKSRILNKEYSRIVSNRRTICLQDLRSIFRGQRALAVMDSVLEEEGLALLFKEPTVLITKEIVDKMVGLLQNFNSQNLRDAINNYQVLLLSYSKVHTDIYKFYEAYPEYTFENKYFVNSNLAEMQRLYYQIEREVEAAINGFQSHYAIKPSARELENVLFPLDGE